MTLNRIRGINDVAEWNLCSGCGACAFVQPDVVHMVDDLDAGRRPVVAQGATGSRLPTLPGLAICPGVELGHDAPPKGGPGDLDPAWGPVLEVWEGHATDPEIRYAGSSGGIASALALHALEHEGMHGLLHIRAREDVPYLNETVLSRSRDDILSATGSRYAPASPCDRLDLIEQAPSPCVFIGKPCDVAATHKARRLRPKLDAKLGLTVAIFCAGTPTTRGTLEMLSDMGIEDPRDIVALRYRGNGWPGDAVASVRTPSGDVEERNLTYQQSWGDILQRHRQWRCYVCADHTGEFADIAVGDPWYRDIQPGELGESLILVRTERGRSALNRAIAGGAVKAERADSSTLPSSQPGLLRVRGAVGGRIWVLRLLGIPAPRYRNMPMLTTWVRTLNLRGKLRSTIGTMKRIWGRKLYQRHAVVPLQLPDSTSWE